jgi:hypothetical protein
MLCMASGDGLPPRAAAFASARLSKPARISTSSLWYRAEPLPPPPPLLLPGVSLKKGEPMPFRGVGGSLAVDGESTYGSESLTTLGGKRVWSERPTPPAETGTGWWPCMPLPAPEYLVDEGG